MSASEENPLLNLEGMDSDPLPTSVAISALAMNFAMKWHDMSLIKDGAMYQQKKLEGANIELISLDSVFETAARFERHFLTSSDRIAGIVIDVLAEIPEEQS